MGLISGKKPSYEELERQLKRVTRERDDLQSKLSAIATLSDILLTSYKSALVVLSSLNSHYPCVNCSHRTSATSCKQSEVCKNYSHWKWKLLP